MSSKIHTIYAREILDSRGNPTVESTVIYESGYRGTASVPSGASKGSLEALELRDGDKNRYNGNGVLKAVANVNKEIARKLRGMDGLNQENIDKTMIDLDGTENKSKLGANSILAVSMANAIAGSRFRRMPLYSYLYEIFNKLYQFQIKRIPTPTFNMINGGLHGTGNLNFQEFHIVPATNKTFHEALQLGVEIFYSIKNILKSRNAIHAVGDEGGFTPNLFTNMDALEILFEGIKNTRYRLGSDVFFGLDVAANTFLTDRGYQIKDRPVAFSKDEFINYFVELNKKYRLIILEDPLSEDDWESWKKLTQKLKEEVLIVGDDLLVTNPKRLEKAISEGACNGLLAKPNQIGTITEFMNVCSIAKKNGIKIIVAHRSGETTSSFVADLAVAIGSEYVKFGAPNRGERIVKYNRLLEIESEILSSKK